MRPTLHPRLVNGRYGDPAVFVEALHRPGALLFDLGDLAPLSTRDLLFDRLLRVNVGRDKRIVMIGPADFAKAVGRKLQAYTWDLVDRYSTDLVFQTIEVHGADSLCAACFRLKKGFAPQPVELPRFEQGPAIEFDDFNVWRNRLAERGLQPGPWLQALKRAVFADEADQVPIALPSGAVRPLGSLRDLVSVERGQKIAYVTDVADTSANRAAVASLASEADMLFIEACFSAADRDLAASRAHLTTRAAGEIGRDARVRRIEPFHFSPRYEGEEERMIGEVMAACG
jgi:ribonuclease Z